MAAVVVAGWRFHWQINQPEFLIHRDLGPYTCVARILRRPVQPSVVAELALHRNGVEGPQTLAGSNVKAARIALVIAHALGRHAFAEGRTNEDSVLGHDRRRLNPD